MRDGCLAWVGVHPLNLRLPSTKKLLSSQGQAMPSPSTRIYHLQRFEVHRILMEREIWLAKSDILDKLSAFAHGDDELLAKLDAWKVRLDELVRPDKVDYPI